MPWLALVAIYVAGASAAPSDVPKSHWAHAAVDDLFREGLLDGYPAVGMPKVSLRLDIPTDEDFIERTLISLKKVGVTVGYMYGLHWVRTRDKYETSVEAHVAMMNILALPPGDGGLPEVANRIPDLLRVISMRADVMRTLGADPEKMVRDLALFRNKHFSGTLFRG